MRTRPRFTVVIIIIVALVPRLLDLNAFLAQDEFLWLDRSRNFLLALQNHDWAKTFQTGHPAVTTMWSGSLGLWLYGFRHDLIQSGTFGPFLRGLSWNHHYLELLTYLRLPVAVVTSLGIGGVAYLLTRLFDHRVGLIGGGLLALDPWYLAHSRVLHHDALMSTFMTLSALALLLHIRREPGRWALVISGVCAGLALLSKALSLFLLPWTALLFIVAVWLRKWPLSKVLTDGGIWGLTAWITFFTLWPAMWLRPVDTLWRMRQMVTTYAINPHPSGQFFMGQTTPDPGLLFYPLVALFALTPVAALGLAALVVKQATGSSQSANKPNDRSLRPVVLLLLYVGAFMLFTSLGEKKQSRYVLPSMVMLNVIAAVGVSGIVDKIGRSRIVYGLLTVVALIGHGVTSLPYHPHYSTYYNPILGGNQAAARYLLVGWGEGNDLAARYLNGLPDGDTLTVVASKPTTFAPYFHGQTLLWWPAAKVFAADYVVLHRRDVQRDQPDPDIVRHIRETWPLEETVTLHGLPYVWIYRAPAANWTRSLEDEDGPIGRTGLLAYRVDPHSLTKGQGLTVTLYRQQSLSLEGRWAVQLQGTGGQWDARLQTTGATPPVPEPGAMLEEVYSVDNTSAIPSGVYQLKIGFQREADATVTWLSFPEPPQVRVAGQ